MRVKSQGSSANRRSLFFLARFLGLLVAFYLLAASHPVDRAVIVPFTSAIARVSAGVLNVLGERVTVSGTEVRSGLFAVQIENGCNGVETALLFGSAVLAFPAPWRRRLIGLLLGFIAIQLVNLVRVVTLFWIGAHRPAFFSATHTVVWQSVVVLCGVILFLLWASREARASVAAESRAKELAEHGPPRSR